MPPTRKHKRRNFTKAQKAEIFVRDRATCCYTGQSCWVLDYGPTPPLWDSDWTEHRIPSAKGGTAETSNGICASSFYNWKRGVNTNDKYYLFDRGAPTHWYISVYGSLSSEHKRQLVRFGKLHHSDWYFNRSLAQIFYAYQRRCEKERFGTQSGWTVKRHLGIAWNHLRDYQKIVAKEGVPSMESRGLLSKPLSLDVRRLLRLRTVETESDFKLQVEKTYASFHRNFRHYYDYQESGSTKAMMSAYKKADRDRLCSPMLKHALYTHQAFLQSQAQYPDWQDDVAE